MQSLAEHFNCTVDQVTTELIIKASVMDTRLRFMNIFSEQITTCVRLFCLSERLQSVPKCIHWLNNVCNLKKN